MAASFRTAVIGCGRTASLFEEDPLRRKPASHMGHYRKSRRIVAAAVVVVVAGATPSDRRIGESVSTEAL